MKPHIFSLILRAIIFTTNPLFGMNPEDDAKTKGTVRCFTDINEPESKGLFLLLPKGTTLNFISHALVPNNGSLRNITLPCISSLSCTSKSMYNLVQSPELWEAIGKDQNITLKDLPVLSTKDQVIEHLDRLYFKNLFKDRYILYFVKISELQTVKKLNTCYNLGDDPEEVREDRWNRYNFLIDTSLFTLMIMRRERHILDTLSPTSYIKFRILGSSFETNFRKQSISIVPRSSTVGPQANVLEFK